VMVVVIWDGCLTDITLAGYSPWKFPHDKVQFLSAIIICNELFTCDVLRDISTNVTGVYAFKKFIETYNYYLRNGLLLRWRFNYSAFHCDTRL